MDEEEDTTNKMPSQDLDLFLNEYVEQLFSQELDVYAIGLRTEVEDDAAGSFLRGGGGGDDGTNVTNTTNTTNVTTATTTDGRKRERSNNSTNGDENNNEEVQNATKKKEATVLKQNAHA